MQSRTSSGLSERSRKLIFGLLLVGSLVGLAASTVLTYEALVIAKQSDAVLGCDLNAAISCSSVARHWSSTLLGFPNSFIGMLAMPVFVTIAVAGLARTQFPRWFMKAAQAGAVVSLLFAVWMFYMSYAVIQALCPWCLTTDVAVLMILVALVRHNALTDNLCVKGRAARIVKKGVTRQYDIVIAISVIVIAIMLIIAKFGAQLFA